MDNLDTYYTPENVRYSEHNNAQNLPPLQADLSRFNAIKTGALNGGVNTHPLQTEQNKAESHENKGVHVPKEGHFLCDNCGKEKKRMVWNQRFCCTPCRLKFHKFIPHKKGGK